MLSFVVGYVRANVVALSALFIALGGTSYAVVAEPAGSVKVTVRRSTEFKVPPGGLQTVTASCRPGERATGGGNANGGDAAGAIMLVSSQPAFKGNAAQPGQLANGWIITVNNVSYVGGGPGADATVTARVVCIAR